jgi:hypothetical protein
MPGQIPRIGIRSSGLPDEVHEFDLSALHSAADVFHISGMAVEACRLYLLLTEAYLKFRDPPK